MVRVSGAVVEQLRASMPAKSVEDDEANRPPLKGEEVPLSEIQLQKQEDGELGELGVRAGHVNKVKMGLQEWGMDQMFGLLTLGIIAYVALRIGSIF